MKTSILAIGILFLASTVSAADWRLVRQSQYGDATYYDAASVQRMEGGAVSFRARLGAGEYHYEMRCGKEEARLIEDGQEGKWFPVVMSSDEGLIYQELCR